VLLDAVDHGLNVLGATVRQTIYDQIEKMYGLKRESIPEKLDAFHTALTDILGTGAATVERLIAKNLYQRLGLNFTPRVEWTLVEYVEQVKTVVR